MQCNQTGGDLGATWGRPGGDLKWALAQDWVGESKVWQCLGASWDLQNSRYVPYLPIRSRFWAVRACKEKLPTFKDIGLPPDFHKKSGGEPVYAQCSQSWICHLNANWSTQTTTKQIRMPISPQLGQQATKEKLDSHKAFFPSCQIGLWLKPRNVKLPHSPLVAALQTLQTLKCALEVQPVYYHNIVWRYISLGNYCIISVKILKISHKNNHVDMPLMCHMKYCLLEV